MTAHASTEPWPNFGVVVDVATPEAEVIARLTSRELDVLRSLSEGLSGNQIGALLHVSPNTVRTHIQSILPQTSRSLRLHSGGVRSPGWSRRTPGERGCLIRGRGLQAVMYIPGRVGVTRQWGSSSAWLRSWMVSRIMCRTRIKPTEA